ncbi:MAG TPA: cob(I)yrinic acid a,c-diamide adenosyltransferase [Candidatus Kapabacteria bacterium]|nr:cob(I)yrinic acid a,c-diamide adenosyltransferase [Candidatus Kapabacteria bacterium]
MKIYTKTGDDGSTGLFNGQRVKKYSQRVQAYGTVDELNSIIGLARAFNPKTPLDRHLEILSNLLFNLGSDLATPNFPKPKFNVIRLQESSIKFLEDLIDNYTEQLPPLRHFILPGGSPVSAHLHQARTVCRRAERIVVELSKNEELSQVAVIFLNRLSDYLFTAARYSNFLDGLSDHEWDKELNYE